MPLEELKARAAQEAAKQAGAAAAYCTLPCCLLGCTVTPQYASAIATYKCTTLPAVQKQRKAARKKRQIIESDEEEEEQVSKGVYLGPWTLHPLASHLGRTRSWLPPRSQPAPYTNTNTCILQHSSLAPLLQAAVAPEAQAAPAEAEKQVSRPRGWGVCPGLCTLHPGPCTL